ncbi:carboxymuconolactone decarboxylase family protein [Halomarina halobia]|uniref:Carboxymuconolactone decarboxylase family protein n=1 Tax=Halomarina halobia TaxID=3033386 RepID=A0ABD6AEY1_9EURY|nr:carboxymuconolactone decarboxylase family protein [Halomarina sp. PSR21]
MVRIPYVDPDDLPEENRNLLETSMDAGDLEEAHEHLFSTETRNVHRAIGNNPAVLRGFRSSNTTLWNESGVTERQRELVILATARAIDSRYEWHQHVRHALGAGLTPDEIRAIAREDYDSFSDPEAALLTYVAALTQGEVEDDQYTGVAAQFDDSTVVGITMLASKYVGLARALAAFDVDTEEPFVGWGLERL